ncbi:MAG: AAA family ATPase [Elusimicrobiaceae bacterium]
MPNAETGFEKTRKNLEIILRSQTGLVFFNSGEEERGLEILRALADRLGLPLFCWTPSQGLKNDAGDMAVYATGKFFAALQHIDAADKAALYVFFDAGDYLKDPIAISKIKDIAKRFREYTGGIILVSGDFDLPDSLKSYGAYVEAVPPTDEEYRGVVRETLAKLSARGRVVDEMDERGYKMLIAALKGLTLLQAEHVITGAVLDDGRLTADDIAKASEAKKQIVQKEGLLEYYHTTENMSAIAGLDGLKCWLLKRKKIFTDAEKAKAFGLPFPKGILIAGVQGCGKSLCARAVANEWSLPLLRLDPAMLYDKYIGESERNFSKALTFAERMGPAVLWIDEMEKAFAQVSGGDDGGTSKRILGGFLTWLAERKGDVFVVATANDISGIPPELARKGRFDEIFFVDLPSEADRKILFDLHLKKRGKNPAAFYTETLAKAAPGFSGAEVEQAIVSAMYTAFSENCELTPQHVLNEIKNTRPLSQTMNEKISALRAWAQGRTVKA